MTKSSKSTRYKKCYRCWTIHRVGKPFNDHKCVKLGKSRDTA